MFLDTPEKGVCLSVTSLFYASCQCNKCGFEISWLWRENTVFYFPIISMYCCYELSYVFYIYIFIVYYSVVRLFFLTHFLKKVLCLFTHDVTIIWNWHRGAYIFCSCRWNRYVILKLLTWARKYNILFHKNKTILLLCERSELFIVKNVYLGFFDKFNLLQSSHGFTYWWIHVFVCTL